MEISATTLGTIEQEQNRLICIMNAIDKVIKTTEFDELWQAYKMELSEAFQRWTACTELANASEITKWVRFCLSSIRFTNSFSCNE